MPRIAGAYFSETEEYVGAGGTRRAVLMRVHWFVVILDDGRHTVQPLNADNLPGGFRRIVARDDFLADFAPDPEHYNQHLRPVLESLKSKIGKNEGYVDINQFSECEKVVYKALQVDDKFGKTVVPAAGKHRIVRELLECLPVMEERLFAFQCAVNDKSIELRKSGDYERSIHFFHKALRIQPDDDHLMFNLARAYWHNEEHDKCAEQLERALEVNPGFVEARRFAKYLQRSKRKAGKVSAPVAKQPVAKASPNFDIDLGLDDIDIQGDACEWNIDRRRVPCVILDIEALCTVVIGTKKFVSRIVDLSEHGARLECQEIPPTSEGQRIVIMEQPGLLSDVLGMRKADVVWMNGKQMGVRFLIPLDITSSELMEILKD